MPPQPREIFDSYDDCILQLLLQNFEEKVGRFTTSSLGPDEKISSKNKINIQYNCQNLSNKLGLYGMPFSLVELS